MLVTYLNDEVRINRYIVGCKFSFDTAINLDGMGINRYIVGCKLPLSICIAFFLYEN